MLKLCSLAVTISVLGSSLLRSVEMSSVSLWVHLFFLQRGRGIHWVKPFIWPLKWRLSGQPLQRYLYQSQVSGAVCDHEESEMEYWTQTAQNWAIIAGFACPLPSGSHHKREGKGLYSWGRSAETSQAGTNLSLTFSPLSANVSKDFVEGYLQGFIFWQCTPKPPFHWTKL